MSDDQWRVGPVGDNDGSRPDPCGGSSIRPNGDETPIKAGRPSICEGRQILEECLLI